MKNLVIVFLKSSMLSSDAIIDGHQIRQYLCLVSDILCTKCKKCQNVSLSDVINILQTFFLYLVLYYRYTLNV